MCLPLPFHSLSKLQHGDTREELIREYSNGTPTQQVIWFDNYPIAVTTATTPLAYIQPDHLGTPRTIIDAANNQPIWTWDLKGEAFGATAPNEDPDTNGIPYTFDLRFPGQRHDAISQLNYNYFRDYDPTTGRYAQSDPIGLGGGISTYGYVSARPLFLTDPDGLKARVCCKKLDYIGKLNIRHCYIEVETNGVSNTWGLFGNTAGPLSTYGAIYRNHSFDRGGDCGAWNESCDTDECVRMQVIKYNNPSVYSFAAGPNSNTFAGTIARACNLSNNGILGTYPGYNDQPAGRHIPIKDIIFIKPPFKNFSSP